MKWVSAVSLWLGVLLCSAVGENTQATAWTGRLLVVPMDGSHWTGLKAVAEELGRRGHMVVVVMPEVSMRLDSGKHYITKKFPVRYGQDLIEEITAFQLEELSDSTKTLVERVTGKFNNFRTVINLLTSTCESLFFDDELMGFLREFHFDAVLTDPAMPVGAILAYNLSLPAVYMLRGLPCGMDSRGTACPDPPSYIPRLFTKNSDRMSFSERVLNVLVSLLEPLLCKAFYWPFEEVASRFLQRAVNMQEILSTGALWLFRYDFAVEFPRPLMPNMVLIGGFNCALKSPLSLDIEDFVEGSGVHGVVVFTLGSLVPSMPAEKASIFFEAFSQIPQRVLWRYTGDVPDKVPENVKLMKWLPQNDLLGHPKTRAFITHAGTHGIYEGICHGVPMVMVPLFGDQEDNAHRMSNRGVGVILDIHEVTVPMLIDALNTVINDSSYKERMMKLSAVHNDRPVEPLDLAVYWTEFVMRHKGAGHLRPAAHDLNWFQYHSLDVIGFLLVVMTVVVVAMIKCCTFCLQRCKRKAHKRKEE
ncbi:UDP-glucuronosyltransferase 1A1-like isoform X2 [Brachyhypopomus gauderio]|uniref:UDP-glucuronosyltransferase 1A1-like isoform X2 n=1 Tax=Brachyhypopomus gauderio TaxID=698409 RepID=UPI004041A5A0